MKITNRDARRYVEQKLPFEGSNLFAEWRTVGSDQWYVVYSYGGHWPLFIYTHGVWFENQDRYSVTTSKHRSQARPHCPTVLLPAEWMRQLVEGGYQAIAKARVIEGEGVAE